MSRVAAPGDARAILGALALLAEGPFKGKTVKMPTRGAAGTAQIEDLHGVLARTSPPEHNNGRTT